MWFSDAFREGKEALGQRRYVILNTILFIVAVVAGLYFLATDIQINLFTKGLIGVLLFAIILTATLLDHAVRLRRKVTPKVELDVDDGSVVDTDLKFVGPDGSINTTRAQYVRVKVSNKGLQTAANCEAILQDVRRRAADGKTWEDTGFHDAIDLPWSVRSPREYDPINIGVGARRYVPILHFRSDLDDGVQYVNNWPFRLLRLFRKPGEYQLVIAVLSEGSTTAVPFIMTTTGKWGGFSIRRE